MVTASQMDRVVRGDNVITDTSISKIYHAHKYHQDFASRPGSKAPIYSSMVGVDKNWGSGALSRTCSITLVVWLFCWGAGSERRTDTSAHNETMQPPLIPAEAIANRNMLQLIIIGGDGIKSSKKMTVSPT
mmetsp:Transcript_25707/g.52282  ORF Transcript_25707/g.52282 Transcript_25707/m.52282 type:complete len:131 (+) Transcript_25707:115-507(+)